MNITEEIKLTDKDVFSFQIFHAYRQLQTWIFIMVGLLILVLTGYTYGAVDMTYTGLYAICGLLFIFYTPLNLRNSSKHAVKGDAPLAQKIRYEFSDSGIKSAFATDVSLETKAKGENQAASVAWKQVYKIKETKSAFYIYTSTKNASILPKNQLKDEEALRQLLKKNVETF